MTECMPGGIAITAPAENRCRHHLACHTPLKPSGTSKPIEPRHVNQ